MICRSEVAGVCIIKNDLIKLLNGARVDAPKGAAKPSAGCHSKVQETVRALTSQLLAFVLLFMIGITAIGISAAQAKAPVAAVPAAAAVPTVAKLKTMLVLGDSLSAAYGISVQQGWVMQMAARLRAEKRPWQVQNISISGETTAGGRARLAKALALHKPALVLIALGANDGLRGLPTEVLQANLLAMVEASKASGAQVLLIGIRIPPNYGPDYTRAFELAFKTVASAEKVPLLPFLLEPIARDDLAFQADRLHPTAAAQAALEKHVFAAVLPLIANASKK